MTIMNRTELATENNCHKRKVKRQSILVRWNLNIHFKTIMIATIVRNEKNYNEYSNKKTNNTNLVDSD